MTSHRITSYTTPYHIMSCHCRSKQIHSSDVVVSWNGILPTKNKIIGTICVYYGESNGFGLPNRLGTANSIQYSSYHVYIYIYNWGSSTYIRLDLIKTSSSNQGHSRISQLLHWTPGLSNMLALCGSFNNCGHLKNWMIWGLGNLQICSYDHLCSRSWNPQL